MCQEHVIAKKTIDEKIRNNESFSFEEITSTILENGGILRVSPGTTIGCYIEKLEEYGILEYNPNIDNFVVL